jgi:voltage-gated potassium channel Kch
MIYPEDHFKRNWDIFIALVLVFSCLVSPYRVALIDDDTPGWIFINTLVDILFLLDILIIFNSAYFNDDFQLILSRKEIAKNYLNSWFLIDLVAITPFDLFLDTRSNYNEIVRITRIGKMYKLVKLMRLFRTFKMVKEKNKILSYM